METPHIETNNYQNAGEGRVESDCSLLQTEVYLI
jgi:hypothetical protein